ncbi:recombination regulator RecX [Enterococcus sp. 669A]|uniref:Regulatory protein RecX n=1 Tax=Candidatus Enterococcus moelleringii TaxID=2815325 RepID=A0ABS3LGF4_9ENTE|nr:recombination regulator RecX [Enterococcus sp. 669A]MBO1308713.1 recombination regulator RecX [Enterococcus sp. 669A]
MITVSKVNKGRNAFYKVELSNGEVLRVSEDTLISYRLLKDREITEKEIEEIKNAGNEDAGFQLALNYLGYQMRTEKEIHTYLKDKEIDLTDRKKIIERLREMNLLDDVAFGESFVRTQMRLSDKGPRVVKQKLKEKGLNDQDIEKSLALYEEDDQYDVALQTAEKAMRKYHDKSVREIQQKLHQTMMSKGFSTDIIKRVIAEMDFDEIQEQEEDALEIQGDRLWRSNQRFAKAKRKQKVKQSLYQKGFNLDAIDAFITKKEEEDDE